MEFIFKILNYIKILYNRPAMQKKLRYLYEYHLKQRNLNLKESNETSLLKILEYSQLYCPYYKDLYCENDIDINDIKNFNKIPFLDKEKIKKNYSSIQSIEKKRVTNYIMNTGGTTGTPLTFPVSSHYEYEHQEFAFKLLGYTKGDLIICVDGERNNDKLLKENIYWRKVRHNNLPYGSIAFSALYITKDTVQYYIDQLNILKPSFIRGYPTAINYLSVYIIENNIQLSFSLKAIQLTAEVIFPEQISNIKKAFKCNVGLQYSHSEISIFAYTFDESYEYYCSPFYGFTEVIGSEGKHVSINEVGEIVVTGFYNKAMPFIRYNTGDLALYKGTTNGIVKLGHVYGRNQDFLFDKSGEKIYLIGIIYGGHHPFFNNIKKWQIIQNEFGLINIKIVKGETFSNNDITSIKNLFLNIYGISSNIDFVDEIEFTSRGKNKFVIQNVIQ